MNEWWISLSVLQQVMFVIGATTLLFMIAQIVMMLIGLGGHDISTEADLSGLGDGAVETDVDVADVDVDADGELCTHPEGMEHFHALGFRLLSLRCIIVFFCFGAWMTFIMDGFMQWYFALLLGGVVGFAAAVGMALILGEMMKLQSDGTIKFKNCVGKSGEVYLTIPAARGGNGKVNVCVQETYAEFEAVTDDDEPINTGETVKVVKAQGNLLVVERVKEKNRQSKTVPLK